MKKLLICSLLLASGLASAQQSNIYAGATVGQAKVDLGNISGDVAQAVRDAGATNVASNQDDTGTAWKVFAGYRLHQNLAIEGGYVDLGKYTANVSGTFGGADGNINANVKSSGFFADVVGVLPLNPNFSLFAKAGVAQLRTKAEVSAGWNGLAVASASETKNETVPKLGIGVDYNFTPSLALRAEYEKYFKVGDKNTTGESDVDVLSVGVKLSF